MRRRPLFFSLATVLLLSLTGAHCALAEPPAPIPYVNQRTGECGIFWKGFREEERMPLDPAFGSIGLPWKPEECKRLLDKVLAYPQELRTPSRDMLGEAATKPPCERLAMSLPTSPEHTCKALGYRYVGELPWSSRPCYPSLAPFLGASCAPLIWIHLAVLIVAASLLGTLGYVIFKRWIRRRRELAAAAEDAPTRPQAYR